MSDFDFGVDNSEIPSGGGTFKNPEVGDHTAILRSLIHCGVYREEFKGEKKPAAPEVVAIFELKGKNNFEEDGETPLTLAKPFPIKKGDKAFVTKFRKALDPEGTAKSFDDLIGRPCTVSAKGSKDKGDDGKPKYINFGGIGGITTDSEVLEFMEAKGLLSLQVEGVGHCRFEDLTKDAIMELNPVLHVADIVMKAENYEGSKAQEIINEIRKENPDFAKRKPKDDSGSGDDSTSSNDNTPAPPPPADLDDQQEF